MPDDRKAVEGAIDYAILQGGAAPSSRIGAAGWVQGVGYDWLQGRINSGSSLGSRGSILNKLIQAGFGGTFIAPFNDLGNGQVDTSLLVGTGSATFTRATTATTVNSAGTIISVASGTPRSYYDPTTLQYLGYLAEGSRTNLCLQSEDFGTTWLTSAASVSTNSISSPSGSLTADTVTASSASIGLVYQQISATAVAHTESVWIKSGTATNVRVDIVTAAFAAGASCIFNLSAGTAGAVIHYGASSGFAATIKQYPNGWYRVSLGGTLTAANWFFQIGTLDGAGTFFYAWGAQLEAGSFASSYIPTTTASVTRNADNLSYVFAGNALTTAGACYVETQTLGWATDANQRTLIGFGVGAADVLYANNANATTMNTSDGTSFPSKTGLSSMNTAQRKRAASWGADGLLVTGDGLAVASAAFDGAMPNNAIRVGWGGGEVWGGVIKNVRIFQTQLSASQLQAVTA